MLSVKSDNKKSGLSCKCLLNITPPLPALVYFLAAGAILCVTALCIVAVGLSHPARTFITQYEPQIYIGDEVPMQGMTPERSYQYISGILEQKDVVPNHNLASFTTTYMDTEAELLVKNGMIKNFADKHEYAGTDEIHQKCISMISKLWHAPESIGTSTVGSSEAFMLAGLAMKWHWKEFREARGLPTTQPNIIMGATAHLSLKQFAKFFDVELRTAPVSTDLYLSDPKDMIDLVDENTIGIVAILGSTYNGVYEDIKGLNDALLRLNAEKGWDVGIHVDGASGAFVAPFAHPDVEWDFRLPLVRSINSSGHKYGLVYAGLGWVMFREKKYLSKELYHKYNYLGGGEQFSFSINFSRPSHQVLAQYYNLVHLGFEGYAKLMKDLQKQSLLVEDELTKIDVFTINTRGVANRLPVVAFSLQKGFDTFTEFELADKLETKGWMVPAYAMMPRKDAPDVKMNMMRIVCRNDFNDESRRKLMADLKVAIAELTAEKTSVTSGK